MKIITRYLASEVYGSMLAASIVLLGIFLSNFLVRFMHSAANGILSGSVVKILVLLQLPILAAVLLPAALFLGILFAYGRIYADSEMVVLASCGVSKQQLLKLTLIFALPVIVLVATLSLWIGPKIYKYSDHIASGATTHKLEMLKASYFNELPGGKWVFYAKSFDAITKKFYHVFATERPENGSSEVSTAYVILAKSAYQKVDPKTGDLYIILEDGYRYVGTPGTKNYEVIKYHEHGIRIKQEEVAWYRDASSKPTMQLWQERHDNCAVAELEWRISLPLSALLLTLIAVPLSEVRPKHGRYTKFVPAVLLYIFYANFLFLAKAWIRRGVLNPFVGMWWVHGVMLCVALILLGRQLGWWNFNMRLKLRENSP